MPPATPAPAPKTAPGEGVGRSKNRAWGFFGDSVSRSCEIDPQVVEAHLVKTTTAPRTAPGVPHWPSRDPIGERGGLNLYAFVENDAVNWWDYLGLLQWTNENVVTRYDLDPFGSEIESYPGAELKMRAWLYDNFLAVTTVAWTIKPKCCKDSNGWHFIEYEVSFTPIVRMRSSEIFRGYESEEERRWATRAESDHWNDFYRWTYEARGIAEGIEEDSSSMIFSDVRECEAKMAKRLQDALKLSFEAAGRASIEEHDTSGRHTWDNSDRRP